MDDIPSESVEVVKYSLKMMNSTKKSEYTIQKFTSHKFFSVAALKKFLHDKFSAALPTAMDVEVGFILPGHGLRGKQEWLCEDSDLCQMYLLYSGKKEIMLWCFPKNKKANDELSKHGKALLKKSTRVSPYDSQRNKMSEVQSIRKVLQEKHNTKYSPEQLHTWANLIQMKKHSSFDDPPNYPFFRGYTKRVAQQDVSTTPVKQGNAVVRVSPGVSPGKRLSMRSELIDQLGKCVSLLEKGALSQEEYDELQKNIKTDIKSFSEPK